MSGNPFTSYTNSSEPFSFAVLGLGAAVVIPLTLFHSGVLHLIIGRYKAMARKVREAEPYPVLASVLFGWAVFLMLMAHVTELLVWALTLNALGLIRNLRDSLYLSANSYTTLGFGEMLLPREWRELGPIIAISGLFAFALTTSAMINLMDEHYRLVEGLSLARNEKRKLLKSEQARTGTLA